MKQLKKGTLVKVTLPWDGDGSLGIIISSELRESLLGTIGYEYSVYILPLQKTRLYIDGSYLEVIDKKMGEQ